MTTPNFIYLTGEAQPLKLGAEDRRFFAIPQKFHEDALDAGIAAWFGVNKVEAERNFIRSRMGAAVAAVLSASMPCGHSCRHDSKFGFIPEAGCPVHDAAAPAEVPASEPEQCFSTDGEEFRYTELHEALDSIDGDEGLTEGRVIHQADAVRQAASHYFSVDSLLEDIGERAYEDVGEYADTFPDLAKPKVAELQAMVAAWLDANVDISFYSVRNVREITVTADMIKERQS